MFAALLLALALGQAPSAPAVDLAPAIDRLGSFDFDSRVNSARLLRRADPATVVPLLERAVRTHRDEFVRYRSFVLVTGFEPPSASALARELLDDRNDRLRTVAYQWFEHHVDPDVLPRLLAALPTEASEFVRPALTRALAAYGSDPRARAAVGPLVLRGDNLFRGSVIDALGSYRGVYALTDIISVAELDGPLQDDAITAIGRIGDPAGRPVLARLQQTASAEVQPSISAALCLLGVDCPARETFLAETLSFASRNEGQQVLLRSAVHGFGVLATAGRTAAVRTLLEAGRAAPEFVRAPVALGIGTIALRHPAVVLEALTQESSLDAAVDLLVDAFDMLSEDFEEERFYAEARRAFWSSVAGSARRRVAETLIQKLEF